MLKDIVATKALGDYRLYLRFEDGVEGVVDLAPHLSFRGVFEPLRDPEYFAQVGVDAVLGTVVWPNGADLDPDAFLETNYNGVNRYASFRNVQSPVPRFNIDRWRIFHNNSLVQSLNS